MPSSFTRNLGLEKPATGEQAGIWGETANNDYEFLDTAIDGNIYLGLDPVGGFDLTTADGIDSTGRNKVIVWTGSLTQVVTVTISPNDAKKTYIMTHAASGGYAIKFEQGAGGAFQLEPGCSAIIFCDGQGTNAQVSGALYNPQFGMVTVKGQMATSSIVRLTATDAVGNIAFWKDAVPSVAASIGLNFPGGGLSNDLVFSTYLAPVWTERMRIRSDGQLIMNATLNTYQRLAATSNIVNADFHSSAIEIRETNLVANSDPLKLGTEYAPRLSFHWGDLAAAQIGMTSAGILQAMNPDGSLGPFQVSVLSVTTVNASTVNATTATVGTLNASAIAGVATLAVATVNATTVNATTVDTTNLSADNWAGYASPNASGMAPGTQVLATDAAGNCQVSGFFGSNSGNNGTAAIARVYASSDAWIRYYTLANFAAQLAPHLPAPPSNTVWTANQDQNGFSLTSSSGIARIGTKLAIQGGEIPDGNWTGGQMFDQINFYCLGGGNIGVKFRDNAGVWKRIITVSGAGPSFP